MYKSNYFAIGIPTLDDKSLGFIQSIRQQFDIRYYDILPPHFTLFCNLTLSCWKRLKTNLKTYPNCTKKVSFTIQSAMVVPPSPPHCYWYAFLIPDEGFSAFYKFHMLAQTIPLPDTFKQHVPFIPHITVGTFTYEHECKVLVNTINQANIKLTGMVEKISLIIISDNKLQCIDELVLE